MQYLCKENEMQQGEVRLCESTEGNILLYRLEDGFYATQEKCTHLFKSLKKGQVVNGSEIQCPLHKARFDIKSGEVVQWACFPPGVQLLNAVRKEKALRTFPVTVKDGQVYLGKEI